MGGKIAALPVATGQPVTAGATLAVLTPADGKLEAELLAPSRAIGFIKEGQEVRLQLQAFPYQRFGTLAGKVKSVSGTVLGPADVSIPGLQVHEPVFRVRVSLAAGRNRGLWPASIAPARHAANGRGRARPPKPAALAFRSPLCSEPQDMSISALNISGRARLPVIIAAEAAECGLACMAMIARYHGHEIDLNGMRQRFSLSLTGATLRSLMGFADALDLSSRPLRVELSHLRKVQCPAILHWDLDHFRRPGQGRPPPHHHSRSRPRQAPLSMAEASKHFTGVVLELVPTTNFTPIVSHGSLPLWSLWSRMKGDHTAFVQVLVLSLALQVVTFAAPFQLQLVVDQALYPFRYRSVDGAGARFGGLALVQAGLDAFAAGRCAFTASSLRFR